MLALAAAGRAELADLPQKAPLCSPGSSLPSSGGAFAKCSPALEVSPDEVSPHAQQANDH
ncbi:hypothetical protein DV515_00004720 [Chloebia gouldiae]|uniref:Uncharacterized protein n=1 Tax=Chloebia gouldiae TaxID=44316 RepID=A0A3L8SQF9_CHLGU|nr:hypothetical protein DV515_00004720 [Chloebia gouldiae]